MITAWIKNFLILYLFLTLILYLTPKDTYRKYLRFAVKMILLVALFLPLLNKINEEESFFALVEKWSSFQQEKSEFVDVEKLKEMQKEYVLERSADYEKYFGEQE